MAQADETVLHRVDQRDVMLSPWIEDNWKATKRLTLNLGLRYDHATWPYEAGNEMANFDPATAQLVDAKSGSGFARQLIQPDNKDIAPRIGLAYELTPKTVLRAGYGRFYEMLDRFGSENQLALDPPFLLQTSPTTTSKTTPIFLLQGGFPPSWRDAATFNLATAHLRAENMDAVHSAVDQWNAGFQRLLPADATRRLEFRWEAFDIANTPLFGLPSADASEPREAGTDFDSRRRPPRDAICATSNRNSRRKAGADLSF